MNTSSQVGPPSKPRAAAECHPWQNGPPGVPWNPVFMPELPDVETVARRFSYCRGGKLNGGLLTGRLASRWTFAAQTTAVFEVIADVQPRHFPFLAFLHGCGLDHGHHQNVDVVAREPCACG